MLEAVTVRAFREVLGVELPQPFPRMSYREAMDRYGSDKPDTRIQLELVDLTDVVAKSEFKVFAGAVKSGGVVQALPIPTRKSWPRATSTDSEPGAGVGREGLGLDSGDGRRQLAVADRQVLSATGARTDQRASRARARAPVLFGADRDSLVCDILARLRLDLGQRLGRVDDRPWDALFVLDFPLFEQGEDGKLSYMHMPFVAPHEEDLD